MNDGTTLAAVVFDVDGTLVDSERDGHRVAFNRAFEEMGLPHRWEPELYGDLLAIAGGQQRIDSFLAGQGMPEEERLSLAAELHRRKTQVFIELVGEGRVPPRPGAIRLVKELEAAAVPLAVATTGTRAWVEPLLERFFGLDRFAVVVTGDEAPVRKPDSSAHLMTLERLGLPPPGVVAIEDSSSGLTAAAAAGLTCLVVVNDYTRDQDMAAAALVLDGFGGPDASASVLRDPQRVASRGMVDADLLRRLTVRRDAQVS